MPKKPIKAPQTETNLKNHKVEDQPQCNEGSTKEETEGQFYNALSHEIRRRIIRIVGKNLRSSFTEFKQSLNISTGTLYHHLEVLKDLLYQKFDKKYYLTVLGECAFDILEHNTESIETSKEAENKLQVNHLMIIRNITKIWPRNYFTIIQKNHRVPLALIIALLGIGGLLCAIFDVDTTLIFFTWEKNILPISIDIKMWMFFRFIISMLAFYFITEVLCRVILRKRDNPLTYFLSFFMILIPMLFYLVIHSFFICSYI